LTINKRQHLKPVVLFIIGSFFFAHLCFLVLPNVFEIWNVQMIDRLFIFRSSTGHFRPPYDNTVVHVDLNNTSIKQLNSRYLNRSHFTRLIKNLASMGVSSQVYDFIFADRIDEKTDRSMIKAAQEAGNAYFGLAFELHKDNNSNRKKASRTKSAAYLTQTKWKPVVSGDLRGFFTGKSPLSTFDELAAASKGLGFLSVQFDRDGALRRMPLIVRYADAFYPSLPFKIICDYMGVAPENIMIKPGRHILLKGAEKPLKGKPHDILIPIDKKGNMIINYIGPWERMDHYHFSDILLASNHQGELRIWREELKGKIVVVSDVSTGSTDIGPVPTDTHFPLSGVHANVIHNILTESFLR